MTAVERLLGAPAGAEVDRPVDLVVTDDWTTPALAAPLAALGTVCSAVPIVLVHDHTWAPARYAGAERAKATRLRAERRAFATRFGATTLEGRGIQHHTLAESGHLRPGMLVLGNDSHAPTLGAYGVLAFAGQPTTVAATIHTGRLVLRVPPTLLVRLHGRLGPGVTARDAALTLLGRLRTDPDARLAIGAALTFVGPAVAALSPAERAVLANVAPEAVATTALFPAPGGHGGATTGEDGAAAAIDLDLGAVAPAVARSGDPGDVVAVADLAATPVDRVLVGTCAGGTFEEIAAFAAALGDAAIVPTTVVPATAGIAERLVRTGIAARLAAAGVALQPPGCGFCFGFGVDRLGAGEVVAATGNRNGVGRLGHSSARIHLVSGRTAGEVARTGRLGAADGATAAGVRDGTRALGVTWPRRGNVVRLHGRVTTDDLTPSHVPGVGSSSDRDPAVLRRLLLHHVDATAAERDLRDTVIVADEAFGCGSNRASSVRALRVAGVAAVVARSMAPLYAQGARDEGFPVVALDDDAFMALADRDAHVALDLDAGVVRAAGRTFAVAPATPYERALRRAGGVVGYLTSGRAA